MEMVRGWSGSFEQKTHEHGSLQPHILFCENGAPKPKLWHLRASFPEDRSIARKDYRRKCLFSELLRWHVCRVNFARKMFFEPRIFLRKMLRNFPRKFRAFVFCGSEKIPGKFPPNFPLNFPNFPAENQKKSPTSFCRSAERRIKLPKNYLALKRKYFFWN